MLIHHLISSAHHIVPALHLSAAHIVHLLPGLRNMAGGPGYHR